MIQSKIEAFYEAKGVKKAIIQIEVDSFVQNRQDGITFNVIDYAVTKDDEGNDVKEPINMYTVFKTNEQVDNISNHLKLSKDYDSLTETHAFWEKIKDELFYYVTQKTYDNGMTDYRLYPEDWELI